MSAASKVIVQPQVPAPLPSKLCPCSLYNNDFLMRAAACHDDLLAALTLALPIIDGYRAGSAAVIDAIKAAIAKAGG